MSSAETEQGHQNPDNHSDIIQIDGSLIEGGGQSTLTPQTAPRAFRIMMVVLRNAAAYACLFGTPIEIRNIRRNRRVPGLNEQQLCGLRLLSEITGGELEGGFVGSPQIFFRPGKKRHFGRNVATASSGSACVFP